MTRMLLLAAFFGLATGNAGAQAPTTHHHKHTATRATNGGEKPVDLGPNTPEANGAYQGGGVVLQGKPGGPAPSPQATPPGQTPEGAVPR